MSRFQGKTVLVTGAASGIGRLMAVRSLREGAARVVAWDLHEENLAESVSALRVAGHDVVGRRVDVSRVEEIRQAAQAVLNEIGPVDILFNNAGVVVGKPFHDHTPEDIERTIRVNVLGAMHVAAAFLPAMIERGRGHIINISSASGYVPNPNMSVYAASKWAVLGWSESLRLELERLRGDLHVTTVAPSYIDTGMFAGVKAPLLTPILRPDRLVTQVIEAVKRNKILVRAPFMVNLVPVLRGLLPARVFDFVGGRLFGVYKTMDTFVGRPGEPTEPDRSTPAGPDRNGS